MPIYQSVFFPLVINILRYVVMAGIPFLIFYVLFPSFFSKQKNQTRLAKNKDFIREILHSMQTTAAIAGIAYLIMHTSLKEYTMMYTDLATYPMWWFVLSIILALMIHDTYFYWTHRAMHHPKLFKWVHLLHHKSVNPSPWASYSFHIFEAIIELMVVPIILMLIPLHPYAILFFTTASFIINVYGHLGYEIAPRRFRHAWLFEMMNTSEHHNLHHKKFKGNYGLYFRFWDRAMKTEYPDYVKEYDLIQEKRFGAAGFTSSFKLRHTLLLLMLLVGLSCLSAFGQSSIEGRWRDEETKGVIEIYQKNGTYYGRVVGSDDPEEQKKIEQQEVLVLKDFRKESKNTFCCGTMYQPREKRTVTGTLELVDAHTLKIHGRYGIFRATRIWKRV